MLYSHTTSGYHPREYRWRTRYHRKFYWTDLACKLVARPGTQLKWTHPWVLYSFHYFTLFPRHRSLISMPITESQHLRKVLRHRLTLSWKKGTGGPGTAWLGGHILKLDVSSALTIFLNKWETKSYGTQKHSACVNSYVRENKNLLQHLQRASLIINAKFLSFLRNYFPY